MPWILAALASPAAYGLANVLDHGLADRFEKSPWALVVFSSVLNVAFLPLAFFAGTPAFPDARTLPLIALIAVTDIAYLFPYYAALRAADTSVVTSLFSIGQAFVPILAFFTLGERLSTTHYAGFVLVILSATLLTMPPRRRIRADRAFLLMTAASALLAVQAVAYKATFETASWSTGFVWPTLLTALIAACGLLSQRVRREAKDALPAARRGIAWLLATEFLTFAGAAAATFAISLVPVTVVKGLGSLQPFFVLGYGVACKGPYPKFIREATDGRTVARKALLFLMALAGVLLISA